MTNRKKSSRLVNGWLGITFVLLCACGCEWRTSKCSSKRSPRDDSVILEPRDDGPEGGRSESDLGFNELKSGHEKMVAILQSIKDRAKEEHYYYGRGRREKASRRLASHGPLTNRAERLRALAEAGFAELLFDDTPQRAIEHLTEANELLPTIKFRNQQQQIKWFSDVKFYLGVAWLRMGETQNCCLRHTADSCILPIRRGGIHTDQSGSRMAIRYFSELMENLSDVTDSWQQLRRYEPARWLLNIAYMTLGEYPEKVPAEYLIPPQRFQSDERFPRFENVAPKLHLNTFNHAGCVVVDDFNNDDYLDIFVCSSGPTVQPRYFRNDGDGTFSDRTVEAGLIGLFGGLVMVQGDYDNDGNVDVFIMRGAWMGKYGRVPNSLLRNNGDGTFSDVTFESCLGKINYPSKTAAWADYDNDGDLDLFVANEAQRDSPERPQPNRKLRAPCQLFRNNGDRTFTDVAAEANVQIETFGMGTTWGDYNKDGWCDLFVTGSFAGKSTYCLFQNRGDGTFQNVAPESGIKRPGAPFATWFWDFDNDGNLDIFICNSAGNVGVLAFNNVADEAIAESSGTVNLIANYEKGRMQWGYEMPALYRGDGRGGFQEVAAEQQLQYPTQTMGANFGDVDGDGYLDIYLATGDLPYWELRPNLMFRNLEGRGFSNVSMSGGFGHLQKGHGVSFADIDNDGDQDVYVQMGGQLAGDQYADALFENPGFDHHSITIKLVGRESNRSAIGARIRVEVTEGGDRRSIYRHVNSGGSFGCNPLRQNIGLRKADRIEMLEIHWPKTNLTQTFRDIEMTQTIEIHEGLSEYRVIENKQFVIGEERRE